MFGVIKNRLCKYLLKRLFGRYLDEDLDTVKVIVEGDNLAVQNLRLRSGPGSHLTYLDSACADLVTVHIPWRNLLRDGCKITISGFAIEITNEKSDVSSNLAALVSNPRSSSHDPYLHRALLAIFKNDSQDDDLDETGIDELPIGSNKKSLDCVSGYIRQVLSKTHVTITDIRLKVRPAQDVNFIVAIPRLWFQDGVLEFDKGATVYEERVAEPLLVIGDMVRAEFDDYTLTCDIDVIQGRIPVSLLRFFAIPAGSMPQSETRFEQPSSESKAIGDYASISQLKLNVQKAVVVLDSNEAQFGFNLDNVDIDLAIAPKIALRSFSIGVGEIIDEICSIPVLQFTPRDQHRKPNFLLRSNGLDLQPFLVSADMDTLYRLKALLRESLKQIPTRKALSYTDQKCGDFVVSVMGPIVLHYIGYLEVLIDSPIAAVIGADTTVLSIEHSLIEIREIQQGRIMFSSTLSCSIRFRYLNDLASTIPAIFPNKRRTSSRIYQTDDFVSDRDGLLLPVSYKLAYMDAAQITASCQLANIEVHLNEHVLTGLYSVFQNHSRNLAASTVDLSNFSCSWAVSASCDEMRVFYTAPNCKFLLLAESGLSVFASPAAVSASVSSLSLKKDSVAIVSHFATPTNLVNFAAFEAWALWREDHADVSVAIRNIVVSLNQDAFDFAECALSIHSMTTKLSNRDDPANSCSSSNRCFSFQSNVEDCAILFSSADPSGPRLTLVFEKLYKTVSRDRLNILLCGLSLHLIDRLPSPITFSSHCGDSLLEYLIDSGHVVILSLDVAEADQHLSALSVNVGHVALMTCADTLTLTYRAGVAIWEDVSPRLLAITSNGKPLDDRFSVSQKHADVVSLAASQVLTRNNASGGLPAVLDAFEGSISEALNVELDDSYLSDERSTGLGHGAQQILSVIEDSYDAAPSATLPNRNEMKALYHNTDFRIIESHFASIDFEAGNEAPFVDQKIVSSDGSFPALKLSLNLRIEGITLRLFGGCDFRERRSFNPAFRSDGPRTGCTEDYMQGICRPLESNSPAPPASYSCVNGSGRHRESADIIEIVLSDLQVSRRSYTFSTTVSESQKFYGTLASIIINDHVKDSHFTKLLGPLVANRRNDRIKALTITIESVNAASYCAEHRVEIQLAPLDLTLDGVTLAFAIQFATGIESVLEPVVATPLEDELDTVQVLANLDPTVYVHFFDCATTALNVTYRPSNADLGCISGPADYIKLLQFDSMVEPVLILVRLPVQDATFVLKHVSLRGLSGYTRAVCDTIQIWARDIARNQYHKYLGSIVPFRSMVRLGSSVRDLVFTPICHRIHHMVPSSNYHHRPRFDTRSGNSIHVARQFGTEAVSLAVVMLSGTEVMLDAVEGRGPNQVYDREPSGFYDGLRCALTSVSEGARLASHSIVGVPLKEWRKHNGGIEAIRSFIRGVPRAVLQPARAATHALKVTLQGLKNTIDADSAERRRRARRRHRR